jgi:2-oxoglutarate dehydrogenase E1 component
MRTGVPEATLKAVGQKLCTLPSGFDLHRRLKPILKRKEEMITQGKGVDWCVPIKAPLVTYQPTDLLMLAIMHRATAEALAFGSLLLEGTHVRLR